MSQFAFCGCDKPHDKKQLMGGKGVLYLAVTKAVCWLTLGYAQTSFLRQTRVISRWLALPKVDWVFP